MEDVRRSNLFDNRSAASAQTMVVLRRLLLRFMVCIIIVGGMFRSLFMPCPLELEMTGAGLDKEWQTMNNMTEPAPRFPLLLSQSNHGGNEMQEDEHINLLESNGNFHEGNCATWYHDGVFECKIEWDEWMLVNAFIQPGDVVIEFGARFGTTSCMISRQVGEFGHVISVEPDISVHGYLLKNRYEHSCNYHAVLGVVSKEPIFMGNLNHYAQMTKLDGKGPGLPRIDVPEIQNVIGSRINVALIDCEGIGIAAHEMFILMINCFLIVWTTHITQNFDLQVAFPSLIKLICSMKRRGWI